MSVNSTDESQGKSSWLERLSHALMREPQDRTQLLELLRDATERELINKESLKMIEGVLQVSQLQVRDIMIPRAQMVVVKHQQTPADALPHIIESTHSRFPVVIENRDEIAGILLAKDLLPYCLDRSEQPELQELVRPATFIPESKRLDVLLKEFRLNRNHMAIVVDEYGGVAGLVTIEDVLEQIVGEISDEFDTEEPAEIKAIAKNRFQVDALTPIDAFNQHFNTTLSAEDFDTIGGIVTHRFGRFPKRGESIEINGLRITIKQTGKRRLHMLTVDVPN